MMVKSYLVGNKLTAASFPITEELVEFGFKARGQYDQHNRKMAQEEERAAAAQREKEEHERLQESIRQDQQWKSHLEALKEKERKHADKLKDAQRCRLEAEVALQNAIANLSSAAGRESSVASEKTSFVEEKNRIEQRAVEKALKKAATESSQLKRQLQADRIKALPNVPKKKKNVVFGTW